MKLEGNVQELELFFKMFTLKEKQKMEIDGEKVSKTIAPSVQK